MRSQRGAAVPVRRAVLVALMMAAVAGCSEPDGGDGGEGLPPETGDRPEWAAPEEAWVRPGVPIGGTSFASFLPQGGSCTANFIFANQSRQALYVGTAAHCFSDSPLGETASVGYAGQTVRATLAYSSWLAMNLTAAQHAEACAKVDVSLSSDRACWNDFALLEIAEADWGHIHPSVLSLWGPTGLGPAPAVGSLVSTYGSSHYRATLGKTTDARSGPVLDVTDQRILIHTGVPSTAGDSGAPVLDGSLQAVGVIVYLHLLPPSTNGAANLAWLLDEARQAGHGVELIPA